MKSTVAWVVGAILAFFVLLLIYLPANQVIGRLQLPSNITIYGISGTLWQGKAQQVDINGLPVANLQWQLKPLALLTGRLSLIIKGGNSRDAQAISFSGPISTGLFSYQRIQAHDFKLYLPVDSVLAQVSLPLPVNASGRFRSTIDSLDYDGQCKTLKGTGSWLNAAVAGTQGPIDFGTYTAALSCEQGDFVIQVDEPNMLGLSMQATVGSEFNRFTVNGRFKPADTLPEEVHQAARLFGQPGANGYTRFSL